MFIIDLKTNKVEDIFISEKYKDINIYEYKYMSGKNFDSSFTIRFAIIKKQFWYRLDKNNNQIKKSIDGELSFLLNGIYERDTQKGLKHILIHCKQENVKQEILKDLKK